MTKKEKNSLFCQTLKRLTLKQHQDETDKSDSILANNEDKFYH